MIPNAFNPLGNDLTIPFNYKKVESVYFPQGSYIITPFYPSGNDTWEHDCIFTAPASGLSGFGARGSAQDTYEFIAVRANSSVYAG